MKRMTVADAEKDFADLVNEVHKNGIGIELEQEHEVIARLLPAREKPGMTIAQFQAFLRTLPKLGDDAEAFAEDIRTIRAQLPAETNAWD